MLEERGIGRASVNIRIIGKGRIENQFSSFADEDSVVVIKLVDDGEVPRPNDDGQRWIRTCRTLNVFTQTISDDHFHGMNEQHGDGKKNLSKHEAKHNLETTSLLSAWTTAPGDQ